ncbi:MAG: cysteine desulfurase family protein [Variibacter sp.]
MRRRIYLDWNATAPLRAEARAAMLAALDIGGNASSVHAEGRAARALIETARGQVATLAGAKPSQVVFTSGATEANVLALGPNLRPAGRSAEKRPVRLFVSAIEHPSVLEGNRFAAGDVEVLPVTAGGVVDIAHLARRLRAAQAAGVAPLISVMAVNNETGVVQPVEEAAALTREAGGFIHVDAVQAAGRVALRFDALGLDLLTLSSHKLGGPQGAGALICSDRVDLGGALIKGGRQERGRRAGTENVAAIMGFGAAAEAASQPDESDQARLTALRHRLEAGLYEAAADTVIFGAEQPRVANTVLFALAGVKAETALIALDLEGVAVSSGAACSSGKVAPSHVLSAMGVPPDIASGAIRVSFGRDTGAEDIDGLLQAWRKHVEALPTRQRGIAA